MDKSQKRIKNLIMDIADNYPAAAIALNNMDFRPTNKIPTAACDYHGNGIYNPEYFDNLSDMNVKAVLLHEALHLYFNHFKRFANFEKVDSYDDIVKNCQKYATKLEAWNIAADSFINEAIIKELPANSLPENYITFTEIKKMTGISRSELEKSSAEKVYKVLIENQEKMQEQLQKMIQNTIAQIQQDQNGGQDQSQNNDGGNQQTQQSQNGNGSQSQQNQTNNSDNSNEQDGKSGQSVQITVIVDSDIQDIIDEVYGNNKSEDDAEPNFTENVDSSLSNDIKSIRAGNQRTHSEIEIIEKVVSISNIEWKEILSEFVYNISGKVSSGRTWQRPSRRYRDIYPISQGRKRKAKTKDFTFAIDVSGSMNKEKIRRAFDIVLDYAKENEMSCKYYFWSTDKSQIYDFTTEREFADNLKRHYGGRTSLECALNNYDADGVGEGLIIVTDLEFDNLIKNDLEKFNGPLVFLDIEPNDDGWNGCKDVYITEIESAGSKYAKFY